MNKIVELNKLKISRIIAKNCMEYSKLASKYSQAFIYNEVVSLTKLINQNNDEFIGILKKLLSPNACCEFDTTLIDLKRSLINLLNSHDLFLDHYKQLLNRIYVNIEKYDYEYLANYFYENYAGYKLFSDFRNYIQHNKLIDFEIEIRDDFFELYIVKEDLSHDEKIPNKLHEEIQSSFDFKMSILIDSWNKSIDAFLFFCIYDLLKKSETSLIEYSEYLKSCGVEDNDLNIYIYSHNKRLRSIPKVSVFNGLKGINSIDSENKYSEIKKIIDEKKSSSETKHLDMFPDVKEKLNKMENNVFNTEYLRRFLESEI
jgi:hypothetical protein